jgi:hypothetical protein
MPAGAAKRPRLSDNVTSAVATRAVEESGECHRD